MTQVWDQGVKVDVGIAQEAIHRSFPELRIDSVKYLKSGWDSSAFLVNGDFVFRFPKRQEVAERLSGEIQLLREFSKSASILVPSHKFIGRPSSKYPFVFSGYELIRGLSQTERNVVLSDREVARLATFLKSLHSLDATRFSKVKLDDPLQSSDWVKDRPKFEERLSALARVDLRLEERVRGFFDGYDWTILDQPFAASLIHNDLLPEHVLVDANENRISGIIDWGDLAIGDPAVDLAGVGYCFGLETLRSVIDQGAYRDPSRVFKRAMLSLVFSALSDVWYGEHQREKVRVDFATRSLLHILNGLDSSRF